MLCIAACVSLCGCACGLEQKIEAAQDNPDELFELMKERTARRKAGKLDGPRVVTGTAGNI